MHIALKYKNGDLRQKQKASSLKLLYGDLGDSSSLNRILEKVNPDEIYNLGAQSHVRISFDVPQFTVQTNALGV